MTCKIKIGLLLLACAALHVVMAAMLELGNAEVYYWVFSTHIQPGYFDHPPMLPWMIWLFSAAGHWQSELAVRAPSIVCGLVSTWLAFDIVRKQRGPAAAWPAAVLYCACHYSGILAGVFALPDGPLMLFWLLALRSGIPLIEKESTPENKYSAWLAFGLFSGLALISKYQAIFLWLGWIIYIAIYDRRHWRGCGIYVGMLTTLAIAGPVIGWQLSHRSQGFLFHGHRLVPGTGFFHPGLFLKQAVSMIVIMNPFVVYVISRSMLGKQGTRFSTSGSWLGCVALPLLLFFGLLSLFRQSLAHWAGPGIATLLVAAALKWDMAAGQKWIFRTLLWALGWTVFLCVGQVLATNYFPGDLSPAQPASSKAQDVTLDMYGWRQSGDGFRKILRQDSQARVMPAGSPVLCPGWANAAHAEFYLTRGTSHPVLALGSLDTIHEYHWLNDRYPTLAAGDTVYYVFPSDQFDYHQLIQLSGLFGQYSLAGVVPVWRSGRKCKELCVFRCSGYRCLSVTGRASPPTRD